MEYIHILPMTVCASLSVAQYMRGRGTRSPLVYTPKVSPNGNANPPWLLTVSALGCLTLTLITTAFVWLSCAPLVVQAIRSSPSQSIENNWNVVIIGAAYLLAV